MSRYKFCTVAGAASMTGRMCRDTPCCIVIEKKAWPLESVSRYRYCIVKSRGLTGWVIVSRYSNCIVTSGLLAGRVMIQSSIS